MNTPSEGLPIDVPMIVEKISQHAVRIRSLPPLKIDFIGTNWKKTQPRLRKRIVAELRKIEPTAWNGGQIWRAVKRESMMVVLPPPTDQAAWQFPLELNFDFLRADMGQDHQCVFVPRLNLSIVAKSNQLTPELIEQQILQSIIRNLQHQDLATALQSLSFRKTTLERVTIPWSLSSRSKPSANNDSKASVAKRTRTLQSVAVDLTAANQGEAIYGVDDRVQRLQEMLFEHGRQSILLVGPSGIGKSALLHRLAWYLVQQATNQRRIWSTTGARIVSGMSGLGMWQERVLKLVRELRDTDGLIHLGSLVELVEAGKIQGQPGVASMVRQAIASGRIQAIAEISPDQIQRIEKEDPLLLRAFVRLDLPAVSDATIDTILRSSLSGSHTITQAALDELQQLFRRFASYSSLPAPALRLLKTIADELPLQSEIQTQHVTKAFSEQSGLPSFLLDDAISIHLDELKTELAKQVIGQPEPVELIVDLMATFKTRLMRAERPLASLLFIGPTGVGKTEMAKAVAKMMYNDASRMIRIDMSEYSNPWSSIRLIGRPGEGDGTLVSPIREQPFSVVLLDEFEKADPAVFDLLLQLLGEGRLTDSIGRVADFRNAIIIMTSNLGVDSFRAEGFGFTNSNTSYREHFERELKRFVRPELLGRIDRVVPFAPLPLDVVRQIVQREVLQVANRPGLKTSGISLAVTPEVVDWLATKGYQPRYGARSVRRAIEQYLVAPLNARLDSEGLRNVQQVSVTLLDNLPNVLLEKQATRSGRQESTATLPLNQARELRLKASLVLRSADYRRLENELDRIRRQRVPIEKQLRTIKSFQTKSNVLERTGDQLERFERRRQKAQAELGELDKRHFQLAERQTRILGVVDAIFALESQLALGWLGNEGLVDHAVVASLTELHESLRDLVVELQGREGKDRKRTFFVLLGKDLRRADLLWRTYLRLAEKQGWSVEPLVLLPYDPLLDETSAAYQRRSIKGALPARLPDGLSEIDFRILSQPNDDGVQTKIIDACRVSRSKPLKTLDSVPSNAVGIAVRIIGRGASSWLSDETGIHHFVHDARAISSKRWRYRFEMLERNLEDWEPPADWSEVPTQSERDPRRIYHFGLQTIHDPINGTNTDWHSRSDVDAFLAMLEEQHQLSLWRSIGFQPIPRSATYGGEHIHEELDELELRS